MYQDTHTHTVLRYNFFLYQEAYGILVLNPNLNFGELKEDDEKSGNRKGSSNKEIPIKVR